MTPEEGLYAGFALGVVLVFVCFILAFLMRGIGKRGGKS
jgi:Na+-transporting methylmalonyl-CoA/oxaloacetate decarboxylase gamma subunit